MRSEKKFYYVIELQFLGFRYHGWQKQPDVKTIQGMVKKTLCFIFDHKDFKTLASGRTDKMVSANSFYFELFTYESLSTDNLLEDLNENLPKDIKALSVQEVDSKFNIIHNSKIKEYLYLFSFGGKNHPFSAPFIMNFKEDLDLPLMQKGARIFVGAHNFQKYCYKPSADTQFEREVLCSEIIENDIFTANFFPNKSYIYKVSGKGFMRYQIRLMMGTLLRLGDHEITLDEIVVSLKGGDNEPLGLIAPPSGLMLNKVEFEGVY